MVFDQDHHDVVIVILPRKQVGSCYWWSVGPLSLIFFSTLEFPQVLVLISFCAFFGLVLLVGLGLEVLGFWGMWKCFSHSMKMVCLNFIESRSSMEEELGFNQSKRTKRKRRKTPWYIP